MPISPCAIFRVCYGDGSSGSNDVQPTAGYRAGDAWELRSAGGYGGRWQHSRERAYVGRVRDYLNQRIWTTPNFQGSSLPLVELVT